MHTKTVIVSYAIIGAAVASSIFFRKKMERDMKRFTKKMEQDRKELEASIAKFSV